MPYISINKSYTKTFAYHHSSGQHAQHTAACRLIKKNLMELDEIITTTEAVDPIANPFRKYSEEQLKAYYQEVEHQYRRRLLEMPSKIIEKQPYKTIKV